MGKRTEGLIEEILDNSRRDRKTVEKIRDQILKLASSPEMMSEPLTSVGIAENIAKLSDVLTKMNAQLVELSKVSSKHDHEDVDPKDEKEQIFDEIESSGETPVDNDLN